jgi:hypothetical protein
MVNRSASASPKALATVSTRAEVRRSVPSGIANRCARGARSAVHASAGRCSKRTPTVVASLALRAVAMNGQLLLFQVTIQKVSPSSSTQPTGVTGKSSSVGSGRGEPAGQPCCSVSATGDGASPPGGEGSAGPEPVGEHPGSEIATIAAATSAPERRRGFRRCGEMAIPARYAAGTRASTVTGSRFG